MRKVDEIDRRNFYTSTPTEMQARPPCVNKEDAQFPDHHVRRYRRALEVLLSYIDIVDDSLRTPEASPVSSAQAARGGSLLPCDLMGALRGSGHTVTPPSLLQTPEEFRRKGRFYRGLMWISFGEGPPL